ncbi:gem-associated protein 8 [Oryzias melastigma]|uniref:Gem (nuclear organelle) associated protein 8 n=1 Tax=Oryzias melastigma TaxID=30732 RepID=A0A3B3BSG1_ORYME|nr:gem-associated protein 8 [Oryzias melastigma]
MDVGAVMSCFSGPMFSRYWQHYHQAMSWHRRHRRAYRKALEAAGGPLRWQQRPDGGRRYADLRADDGQDDREESGSEIECDVSNMEISEELRQYFAETERHREELKKQQQMEAEQQDGYVPADQDLHAVSWRRSAAPPSERPGERRAAEMKKLYGKDAPKILAMEAAMQLTFDRNCDLKQPRYWPVIPLKL